LLSLSSGASTVEEALAKTLDTFEKTIGYDFAPSLAII